jgi:hypothetical protein
MILVRFLNSSANFLRKKNKGMISNTVFVPISVLRARVPLSYATTPTPSPSESPVVPEEDAPNNTTKNTYLKVVESLNTIDLSMMSDGNVEDESHSDITTTQLYDAHASVPDFDDPTSQGNFLRFPMCPPIHTTLEQAIKSNENGAKYNDILQVASSEYKCLLDNLPPGTTTSDLTRILERFGKVKFCRVYDSPLFEADTSSCPIPVSLQQSSKTHAGVKKVRNTHTNTSTLLFYF